MKIPIKKTTCAIMAGAVLFSMTGCSVLEDITGKSSKDPSKDVMEAAEDYCKAIADADDRLLHARGPYRRIIQGG